MNAQHLEILFALKTDKDNNFFSSPQSIIKTIKYLFF